MQGQVRFEPVNYEGHYICHEDFRLKIKEGNGRFFEDHSSFMISKSTSFRFK